MLRLAMERIKIPSTSISCIINLFKERKTRVLIAVGPTENIIASDSIKQGEVLFPLIWRIFYDPLIYRVQSNMNLGYTVLLKEPLDLHNNSYKETKYHQAAIAYADDII
ncbi:reverse transcriptase [Gigaspora margarita]|uniref:Reverse transcriptase n=1 Tax=Gigaspora margarita TaxID=4874 RepID=A0A8H4B1R8_GIGMA|nr:reverse transcriptase [Gigaspora margarita]